MYPKTNFFPPVMLCLLLLGGMSSACTAPKPTLQLPTASVTPAMTPSASSMPAAHPAMVGGPVEIGASTYPYLQEVGAFGQGNVEAVAWSPDGKTLALGGSLGIFLYSLENDTYDFSFDFGEWVSTLAYSPDGQLLVAGTCAGNLFVFNPLEGILLETLQGHRGKVISLVFSPDGTRLASGGEDSTIMLWDPYGGQLLDSFPGQDAYVRALAFHPEGDTLLSLSDTLRIRDLQSGRLLLPPLEVDYSEQFLGVQQDGQSLYTLQRKYSDTNPDQVPWQSYLVTRQIATGQTILETPLLADSVWQAVLSPNQQYAAIAGANTGLQIWDVKTQYRISTLNEPDHSFAALAFSPDSQVLASVTSNGIVRFWRVLTGELINLLQGFGTKMTGADLSPDGRLLAADGNFPCRTLLWDTENGWPIQILNAAPPYLFSPDNRFLLTRDCNTHTHYQRWDTQIWAATTFPLGASDYPTVFAFDSEGDTFAVGGQGEGIITVREAATGRLLREIHTERYEVEGLVFTPQQDILAASRNQVELWDTVTGKSSLPWTLTLIRA
jgi:WD40 repeat protein